MLAVTLTGNLGSDPEIRYTQNGTAMCSFRIAVNSSKRNKDGEYENKTDWFRISVMGARGQRLSELLAKGSKVLIRGRLDIGSYENRDGITVPTYDVWADDVEFIGARPNNNGSTAEQPARSAEPAASAPRQAARATEPEDLDDLPF